MSRKLDNLLAVVHEMNGQLKDQDARLHKQEEKVTARTVCSTISTELAKATQGRRTGSTIKGGALV